jgi:hypothetical protein
MLPDDTLALKGPVKARIISRLASSHHPISDKDLQ